MPADERATLTREQQADRLLRTCDWAGGADALRARVVAAIAQALKEADRRAREDAARIAKSLNTGVGVEIDGVMIALGVMAKSPVASQFLTANAIEAAIRASITTDEGE